LYKNEEVSINLPFIAATSDGLIDLEQTLSHAELQEITEDLLKKTVNISEALLARQRINRQELDSVLLLGSHGTV